MGIPDRIRDELYGSPAKEAENERRVETWASLVDDDDDPWKSRKTLLICLLAEVSVIAILFFTARRVSSYLSDLQTGIYFLILAFGLGATISSKAFSFYTSMVHDPQRRSGEPDLASVYTDDLAAESRFRRIFFASLGGLLNTIVLFALLRIFD